MEPTNNSNNNDINNNIQIVTRIISMSKFGGLAAGPARPRRPFFTDLVCPPGPQRCASTRHRPGPGAVRRDSAGSAAGRCRGSSPSRSPSRIAEARPSMSRTTEKPARTAVTAPGCQL